MARLFADTAEASALDTSSWLRHYAVLVATGALVEAPAAASVDAVPKGPLDQEVRIRTFPKHKAVIESAAAKAGTDVTPWLRRVGVLRAAGLLVQPR